MAVTFTHKVAWDGTNSGSWTPVANRLYLVSLGLFNPGVPTAPTSMSGNGITWAKIRDTSAFVNGSLQKIVSLWYGVSGGSPSAGALTFSGGAHSFEGCVITEVGGDVDLAAPIVQSANNQTDAATSLSCTLAAFGAAANATFATGYVMGFASAAYTPGTGFTELYDGFTADRPFTEYRVDNDTTPDFSWSGTDSAGIVAVELKATSGGGGVVIPVFMHSYRRRRAQ